MKLVILFFIFMTYVPYLQFLTIVSKMYIVESKPLLLAY